MKREIKTRSLIFLMLLPFISLELYGQENYLPGLIVRSETDTLHGYIDYRNWEKNPTKISFKTRINSEETTYTPTDILEFQVKDEIYISAVVDTEIGSKQADKLPEDPKPLIKSDTAFLQTLFNGDKSLFYYKNPDGLENFYILIDNKLILLIYKKYIRREQEAQKIIENKKYRGQLMVYLNDCPSIRGKLDAADYDLKSLHEVFGFYYQCVGSNVAFKKDRDKTSIEMGLITGASLSTIGFSGKGSRYLLEADYKQSTDFAGGLFIDIILSRNQSKWSINNEILYTAYTVQGLYEVFNNENDYTTTDIDLAYTYLKLNNLVRFKYPIGNLFVFVNGGLSNGVAISETNYRKEVQKLFTLERIKEGRAVEETRKYEQGYILGLGLKLQRVSLEARLEKGNGISKLGALNSNTDRYYFLLGYRFN